MMSNHEARAEMRRIEKESNRFNCLMTALVLAIVLLGIFPSLARAQAAKVEVIVYEGTYRAGEFPVCIEKDEAVAVAEAYAKGGVEEADKVLEANGSCAHASIDFMVGQVVFSSTKSDIKVVHVTNPRNPGMSVYWVTTVTVIKVAKKGRSV